jgi:hypothetical protein
MRTHLPRRVWVVAIAAVVVALVLALAAARVERTGPQSHGGLVNGPVAIHHAPWSQGGPGPRGRVGRMGRTGVGTGGTITQITGSTLTLRTEAGTETVTTSSATQYIRERRSIPFSDLRIGDVVHVVAAPGAPGPATGGTGTIAAQRLVVVEPVLAGRVQGIDGDTGTLVGRDGQLVTVTLTDATRYFTGMQPAARSALTMGSRILVAGSQDSLTHLTADTVTVLPAGRRAGRWGRRLHGPGGLGPDRGVDSPGGGLGT